MSRPVLYDSSLDPWNAPELSVSNGAYGNTVGSGALSAGGSDYTPHLLDPSATAFYPMIPSVSPTGISQFQNGSVAQPLPRFGTGDESSSSTHLPWSGVRGVAFQQGSGAASSTPGGTSAGPTCCSLCDSCDSRCILTKTGHTSHRRLVSVRCSTHPILYLCIGIGNAIFGWFAWLNL